MGDWSSSGSDNEKKTVQKVLIQQSSEEPPSVDPSMSEWLSLEQAITLPNPKKVLYEQGLYDPGSGEVCAAYVAQSDSAVFRHVYYNYPGLTDPGIKEALLNPPPKVVYPDDGQDLYMALCKEMGQCPVRIFHRGLLGDRINLAYYGIHTYGVRPMAKALQNNKTVKVLDLTDNFLNYDTCFHLGEMLVYNTALSELNLTGCRIGDSGALRLCAGLPANRVLSVLDLSRNQLGDAGVSHFADAVFSFSDVRQINLSYNSISGKGVHLLADSLEFNNKLTRIDLSRNNMYSFPSSLSNLVTQLIDGPIEYLDLSWNALTGIKQAEAIRNIFSAKQLKHLDISNNKLCTTEVVTLLTANMAKAKKMVTYNVSFNPIYNVEDSLLFIQKMQLKTVKIQVLNMDGINVNDKFIRILQNMKLMKSKQNVIVTYGYIDHTFKGKGPDPREVVLNRCEYICRKMRPKTDIALMTLQLHKDGYDTIAVKDYVEALKAFGAVLDEDLVAELQCVFAGPVSKKGAKRIDIAMMKEYVTRKWPDKKLPKTPPPEPEPIPVPPPPPPDKKGKGKEKGKGKK